MPPNNDDLTGPPGPFGDPGFLDLGPDTDLAEDTRWWDHLEATRPHIPSDPSSPDPTGIFTRPGNKYVEVVERLAHFGALSYQGLEAQTGRTRQALANNASVLNREGFIRNVNPDGGRRNVWVPTDAGIRAAGLPHTAPVVRDHRQAVIAACLADWMVQLLPTSLHLTPRSRITDALVGGVYALPQALDGFDPVVFPYDHAPGFVIDRYGQPTWNVNRTATGYEVVLDLDHPGRLLAILRRYERSGHFAHVVIGTPSTTVADAVMAMAAETRMSEMVSAELLSPTPAMPFDLAVWSS